MNFYIIIGLLIILILFLIYKKLDNTEIKIFPKMGKGKKTGLYDYVEWLRNKGYSEIEIKEELSNQKLYKKYTKEMK